MSIGSKQQQHPEQTSRPPRLGFLGTGWIGRSRMNAVIHERAGVVVAVADRDSNAAADAARLAEGACVLPGLDELLEVGLDGIVIATPSALHAEQAITALERGVAVFVQKPLARTTLETQAVLDAAKHTGLPFGVDLCYRQTRAARVLQEVIKADSLGEIFAADLTFHNAYGPDKPWFLDRRRSGGGCVIDLGTHLIDLVLWLLSEERVEVQAVSLRRQGRPLDDRRSTSQVEDFAIAQMATAGGVSVRLACSWFLPVGRECEFECTIYGTEGSLSLTNVDGSYYDFRLQHRQGTAATLLVEPPDDWGGRAVCSWARQLGNRKGFDEEAAVSLLADARAIDAIYSTAGSQ